MSQAADQNLLLAMLAWQQGLVTETQLVAALESWIPHKQKSLAEILIAQESLRRQQWERLQPLVDAYLKLHENDPARALQTLSAVTPLVENLREQVQDADVQESLHYTTLHSQAGERQELPGGSPPPTSGWLPDSGTTPREQPRYRVIKPHARGGLGEVFLARDEELHREVALKEIQQAYADSAECRSRFLLEAEVTGGLEHPGIVPVYGLGQYADGRPFYAMRFIQGDSLKDAIERYHAQRSENNGRDDSQRTLELRKLLGRFIDVCQAIAYAHARGVLHRDLKPGNIMLGKYGETLVVDWGLARVMGSTRDDQVESHAAQAPIAQTVSRESALQPRSGSGSTPTRMGSAIGTPAYMPPEQAAGRLDLVGPASDVYSLGATLYHLLTGQPPITSGNTGELLKRVQAGNFPAPLEIDRDIAKPLSAICMKAMAVEPAARYGSPRDLAEDLERYLADEPASAFQEPWATRTRRWIRKHQTLTLTTAATILVSLLGATVFSSVLSRKNTELVGLNRSLDERNRELDTTNAELTQANERELAARAEAEANALAAQEQSQLALSTLSSVINDLQFSLAALPGGSEIRRKLLSLALQRLDAMAGDFVSAASVNLSTQQALDQMGDLIIEFGPLQADVASSSETEAASETDPIASSTPASDSTTNSAQAPQSITNLADTFYGRSLKIARQLREEYPDSADVRRALAVALVKKGGIYTTRGQATEALAAYRDAWDLVAALHAEFSEDLGYRRDLTLVRMRLGDALLALEQIDAAAKAYTLALNEAEQILLDRSSDRLASRDAMLARGSLAELAVQTGDMATAVVQFRSAAKQARLSSEENADDMLALGDYVHYASREANTLQMMGRFAEAEVATSQALAGAERLVQLDPSNQGYRMLLANSHMQLGDLLLPRGSGTAAKEHFEKGLQIHQELYQAAPDNQGWRTNLASAYQRLGDYFLQGNDYSQAEEMYAQFEQLSQASLQASVENAAAMHSHSMSLLRLGDAVGNRGDLESAQAYFEQAQELAEQVVEFAPDTAAYRRDLATCYERLGMVCEENLQLQEALHWFTKMAEIKRDLANSDTSDMLAQQEAGIAEGHLGDIHTRLGNWTAAGERYTAAAEGLQRQMKVQPNELYLQFSLANVRATAGGCHLAAGQFSRAVEPLRQSRDFCRQVLADGSDVGLTVQELNILNSALRLAEQEYNPMAAWEEVVATPAELLSDALQMRGLLLSRQKNFRALAPIGAKLAQLPDSNATQLYNAAAMLSLAVESLGVVELEDMQQQKDAWLSAGIAALEQAIERGWTNARALQQDDDLAALRALPDFEPLLQQLEQQ